MRIYPEVLRVTLTIYRGKRREQRESDSRRAVVENRGLALVHRTFTEMAERMASSRSVSRGSPFAEDRC
jgi:hypothetical protein